MTHWIVVADAGSCRIWRTDTTMEDWSIVHELANDPIHKDAAALVSGPRGATRSGPGGVLSAFDRHTDPHEAERQRFAREVAHLLGDALDRWEWERLVLVAPPKFLGLLRGALPMSILERTAASIPRDFTKTPPHKLPEALKGLLEDTAGMDLSP